jgi:hypothetical protein
MSRSTLARPINAGDAVAIGQVVTEDSGDLTPLVGETDQPTTAAIKPFGVALTSAAVGAECTTVFRGECNGLAGGTVEAGDELVAEYETARLIPYTSADYDEGSEIWIVARALEDAADGQQFRIDVDIYLKTVPTAVYVPPEEG